MLTLLSRMLLMWFLHRTPQMMTNRTILTEPSKSIILQLIRIRWSHLAPNSIKKKKLTTIQINQKCSKMKQYRLIKEKVVKCTSENQIIGIILAVKMRVLTIEAWWIWRALMRCRKSIRTIWTRRPKTPNLSLLQKSSNKGRNWGKTTNPKLKLTFMRMKQVRGTLQASREDSNSANLSQDIQF